MHGRITVHSTLRHCTPNLAAAIQKKRTKKGKNILQYLMFFCVFFAFLLDGCGAGVQVLGTWVDILVSWYSAATCGYIPTYRQSPAYMCRPFSLPITAAKNTRSKKKWYILHLQLFLGNRSNRSQAKKDKDKMHQTGQILLVLAWPYSFFFMILDMFLFICHLFIYFCFHFYFK